MGQRWMDALSHTGIFPGIWDVCSYCIKIITITDVRRGKKHVVFIWWKNAKLEFQVWNKKKLKGRRQRLEPAWAESAQTDLFCLGLTGSFYLQADSEKEKQMELGFLERLAAPFTPLFSFFNRHSCIHFENFYTAFLTFRIEWVPACYTEISVKGFQKQFSQCESTPDGTLFLYNHRITPFVCSRPQASKSNE